MATPADPSTGPHRRDGDEEPVTLADPSETQKEHLPPEDSDELGLITQKVMKIRSFGLLLKIHLVVALVVCLVVMTAWKYTANPVNPINQEPQPKRWWWIYPICVFIFTFSAHYYLTQKKFYNIIMAFLIVLNITFFLSWAFHIIPDPIQSPSNESAPGTIPDNPMWPLIPLLVCSCIGAVVQYFHTPAEARKAIRLALNLFWIVNVFLFLIWVEYTPVATDPLPWFLYPLFTLSMPLILWRMKYIHNESRLWTYIAAGLLMLNLLLFLTWLFIPGNFPWPLIVLLVSAAIVFFLYKREAGTLAERKSDQPAWQSTPTTTSVMTQADEPDITV